MSVIGRTWRRAPKFRLLVAFAVTTSALATLFPPDLPGRRDPHRAAQTDPPPADAHYAPPTPRPPLDYSLIQLPPPDIVRSGLVAFAGRQVPLPAGRWTELAMARLGGPLTLQASVYGRVQDRRLTGLLILLGTPPVETVDLRTQRSTACANPIGLAVHELPAGNGDPAVQECWWSRRLDADDLRRTETHDRLLKDALVRLHQIDVDVPDQLVLADYVRTDDGGGLDVRLYLPGGAAQARRTEQWTQRWVPLLHRGFSGDLKAQDVRQTLGRDPGTPD